MTTNLWPSFTLEWAPGFGPFPGGVEIVYAAGTSTVLAAGTTTSYLSAVVDGEVVLDGELILETGIITPTIFVQIPTTDILDVSWTEGRSKGLEDFPPATATVLLKNDDRRYDPDNTAGPNFGLLQPRVPIRFTATSTAGTPYQQFTMFVEDGWEQVYSHPSQGTCRIRLLDMVGVLQGVPIPYTSGYKAAVLTGTSRPVAYWSMDDTSGTAMTDLSGNARDGAYSGFSLGHGPLVADGGSAVHNSNNLSGYFCSYAGQLCSTNLVFEAWLQLDVGTSGNYAILDAADYRSFVSDRVVLFTQDFGAGNVLVVRVISNGGSAVYDWRFTRSFSDQQKHHLVVQVDGGSTPPIAYFDGAPDTPIFISSIGVAAANTFSNLRNWRLGGPSPDLSFFTWNGSVDEVAVYDGVTAASITSHYLTGLTNFAGDMTGAREARVAALIGLASTAYSFSAGRTALGPAIYNTDALTYMRKVARTEQGGLLTAGHDGGKLIAPDRYHLYTDTRSTTPQAVITDDPAASPAIRPEGQPVIEPNGITSVVNQANVTWDGGTVVVSSPSILGPKATNIDTLSPTPFTARSLGQWVIALNKDPSTKVRQLKVRPSADPASWALALGARIGDRVTLRYQPLNRGSVTTRDYWIEGRSVQVTGRQLYEVTFNLSPVFTQPFFTWDVSTWGISTLWAY